MIATLLLVGSSSILQVTRTAINSWMCSNSGQIGLSTFELLALERQTSPYLPLSDRCAFIFDRIFIKLAGNRGSHKFSDEFEFRRGLTIHFGVTCPWESKKPNTWPCPIDSDFIFDQMFFELAGYEDSYKISDKFDFEPDRTIFFGITCPWVRKKFPILIIVQTIATSPLIHSSPILQVTRTANTSRMSSNFGQIRLFT